MEKTDNSLGKSERERGSESSKVLFLKSFFGNSVEQKKVFKLKC